MLRLMHFAVSGARSIRALVMPALAIAWLASPTSVEAQWMLPGLPGFPGFNQCQSCAPPVACNPCVQPVQQTCYRTVPVTEYREVKQTVQRPIVETKYVDQPVTEYRPVVEARTVDIPTVRYETVTECRDVCYQTGQWTAQMIPRPKISPCEYDSSPTLLGAINRSAYSIRSALTPDYKMSYNFEPQTIHQTVPVAHRVPVQELRKVTYNVTKMVPHTTTRKVAVRSVRYVTEEVTAMQPVTVMKTVAVGTSNGLAYAPYPTYAPSTSQTAATPSPDPVSQAKQPSPGRTADSHSKFDDTDSSRETEVRRVPAQKSSYEAPLKNSTSHNYDGESRRASTSSETDSHIAYRMPSMIRSRGGWTASAVLIDDTGVGTPAGPQLIAPGLAVAST